MLIDFTRLIRSIPNFGKFKFDIYAVHKLFVTRTIPKGKLFAKQGVDFCVKFIKKIKKALTRLSNPNTEFVSLVMAGANKNPFLIEQSVQAVPNFSPVGSNNAKTKKTILAVSIEHPTGEVNLSKSLLDKVEGLLGVDVSSFNMTIDQSITLQSVENLDNVEWIKLPLEGTDYTLSFGVATESGEINQNLEIDQFSKNNEDSVIVDVNVEDSTESELRTSEMAEINQATEVIESVETATEDAKEVVDQSEEITLVEETQETAPVVEEKQEEGKEDGLQEETKEVTKTETVDQHVAALTEVIAGLAKTVNALTDKVTSLEAVSANTKKAESEESAVIDQSATEVIYRTLPSSSGAAAVSQDVVSQSANKTSWASSMSAEERAAWARRNGY